MPTERRPSRLIRWKLTEPARLYGYGLGLTPLLVAALALALITGEWLGWSVIAAAQCLATWAAVSAIRATAYSHAATLEAVRVARTAWTVGTAETLNLGASRRTR